MTQFHATDNRYENMKYNRCGNSGLRLPAITLGLWHNFGDNAFQDNAREMILGAFDLGITHFDLANNYGPPPGSAESNFGHILKSDLAAYRNEIIISTKAGYRMWDGPYGCGGSRKYLISSLDESLKRMGLDYVDIFYSHMYDPETPLEETMGALDAIIRKGKATYVGISSYSARKTREASEILRGLGMPCLIHQPSYSMLNRWIEPDLTSTLVDEGIGCIAFSPLAQGLLTDRYLNGVPEGSRATNKQSAFRDFFLKEDVLERVRGLNDIAIRRGQSLAQMALAWCFQNPSMTSLLIGASRLSQLEENVRFVENTEFAQDELADIDQYAVESGINLWAASSDAG
ncbi:MAG: aldo/keto reductase [Verrucomicrobia bacterium]|nr:MAG: aldo/keto reductase [Verrucomicrobiota bacterium]